MKHLTARFWWILVGRGLLGILLGLQALWLMGMVGWRNDHFWGIDALIWPGEVFAMLVFLLGLYAFLDGVFAVILGAQDYGGGRRWWILVAEGILTMGLGFLAWFRPGESVLVLLYWIAFWAILSGLLEMGQGLWGTEYRDRRGFLFYAGLCSMVFGLLILWQGFDSPRLVWTVSLYALISSVPLLVLGFRLRRFALKSI